MKLSGVPIVGGLTEDNTVKIAATLSICSLAMALTCHEAHAQSTKGNDPAWEKIAEAKGAAVSVKPKQCFGDANAWFDEGGKGLEIPTLDLLRRKYEMDACYNLASKLNSRQGEKVTLLMKIESVTYRYTYELFTRAKNVLADHELLNEFLEKEP